MHTRRRPLTRRAVESPSEILDFFIVFEADERLAHSDGWNDGFIVGQELDAMVAELDRGTFRYRGELLHVEWLTGEDAEAARREMPW